MTLGATFIPAWLVVSVIVILAMFAFGLWSKVWTWAKALFTKASGTVSESVDAQVTAWLTGAKSAKVQALLRLVEIEFKARGDTANVDVLDKLIAAAATWKDVEAA